MQELQKIVKNQKAISLVSLIVTIIVLLILAGVAVLVITDNNNIFDNAVESKIMTELQQINESVSNLKNEGEQERVDEGDYSVGITNQDLKDAGVVIKEVEINSLDNIVYIIDAKNLGIDSTLGNNMSFPESAVESLIDLQDVFVFNPETNDIYYINNGLIYTLNGKITEDDIKENQPGDVILPEINVNPSSKPVINTPSFDITINVVKGNNEISLDSKYEYYLSTSKNSLLGGEWKEYVSASKFTVQKQADNVYYLFVRPVKDTEGNTSKSNGTLVLINGEIYQRFGPYGIDNTKDNIILAIDPNGGGINGNKEEFIVVGTTGENYELPVVTPANGYTITFNGNGGTVSPTTLISSKSFKNWVKEGKGEVNGSTYTFGDGMGAVTATFIDNPITLPSDVTREGYTFEGWYTSATEGTRVGGKGASYTPNGDITLYAQWKKIEIYTLTIRKADGTTTTVTGPAGSTVDLSSYRTSPEYYVNFNGNNVGTPSSSRLSDTKSFGSWSYIGAGSISGNIFTFGAGNATVTGSYVNDDKITLPSVSTYTDYTFDGWYTAASGGSYVGQAGTQISPSTYNGQTLYAHGTKAQINTHILNYNVNGGSGSISSQYQYTTATYTYFTVTSSRPSRSNYTFLGWSENSSATSPSYYENNSIYVSGSKTLYAVWQYNQPKEYKYYLYYNANGGTNTPSATEGTSTNPSEYITLYCTYQKPTKTNYTFLGWSESPNATTPTYYAGNAVRVGYDDKTLYAVWQYNGSSGGGSTDNPPTIRFNSPTSVTSWKIIDKETSTSNSYLPEVTATDDKALRTIYYIYTYSNTSYTTISELSKDGHVIWTKSVSGTSATKKLLPGGDTNNMYYVYAYAVDSSGQNSNLAKAGPFWYDSLAPIPDVSNTGNSSSSTTSGTITDQYDIKDSSHYGRASGFTKEIDEREKYGYFSPNFFYAWGINSAAVTYWSRGSGNDLTFNSITFGGYKWYRQVTVEHTYSRNSKYHNEYMSCAAQDGAGNEVKFNIYVN